MRFVSDLLVALGLVLVIEGVLYALWPDAMRRIAMQAAATPAATLRTAGLVAATVGTLAVWLVRG